MQIFPSRGCFKCSQAPSASGAQWVLSERSLPSFPWRKTLHSRGRQLRAQGWAERSRKRSSQARWEGWAGLNHHGGFHQKGTGTLGSSRKPPSCKSSGFSSRLRPGRGGAGERLRSAGESQCHWAPRQDQSSGCGHPPRTLGPGPSALAGSRGHRFLAVLWFPTCTEPPTPASAQGSQCHLAWASAFSGAGPVPRGS